MAEKFTLVAPPPQPQEQTETDQAFTLVAPPPVEGSDIPATPAPEPEMSTFQAAKNIAGRTVGQFGDIAAGVNAGIVGIPQGILEFGASGIDYAFNTNASRAVTDAFETFKGKMGFVPRTTAGEVAENIANFAGIAIPVVGWLGRAATVAQGGKVLKGTSRLAKSAEAFGQSGTGKALLKSRPRQAATTTFAAAAADTLVAPDGTATLADSFDALPATLRTEKDVGLQGRDEAARRLRNKFRQGAESLGVGAAFEVVFPIVGGTAKAVANTPGMATVANIVDKGFGVLADGLEKVPGFKKYLTFSGNTPELIKENITSAEALEQELTNVASKYFSEFEREVKKVVGGQKLFGRGKAGVQKAYDDLLRFMEGDPDALNEYGQNVIVAGRKMRNQVDGLSDTIARQIERTEIDDTLKINLLQEFEENKGKYLRRVYEGALDPEKMVTVGTRENALYKSAVQEISEMLRKEDFDLIKQGTLAAPRSREQYEEAAERIVRENVFERQLNEGVDEIQAARVYRQNLKEGQNQIKERPLFNIAEGMLQDRLLKYEKSKSLRALRGERRDARDVYLYTVGDMSRLIASNNLYDDIARNYMDSIDTAVTKINQGVRPTAISGANLTRTDERFLVEQGYEKLGDFNADSVFGGQFGALSGSYVTPGLKDSLTLPARYVGGVANELLAVSLQAKGISQMTKTVLNPLAQMRNALSGIFMVGANGNIARDMDFWDSMRLTMGKAADLSQDEFMEFYQRMGKLGIRDQNLMVNEFERLLKEGAEERFAGATAGGIQKLMDTVPGVKFAQDVYSGTDTFWKIAGLFGERGKFATALQKAGINPEQITPEVQQALLDSGVAKRASGLEGALDDVPFLDIMASDIVKATMPTYSRVPQAIRGIQRIPVFGNFVAFPAEIIRNSANIVRQSTREMAFKATPELVASVGEQAARRLEREIRAIGAKRVSSYLSMAYVLPGAIQKSAMELTGATEEELEALQRVVPDYMKGHTLFFLEKPKDGKAQYLDFSYMNPYDYAIDPARQALRVYNEKGELSDNEVNNIASALFAGIGSFMEPFASESLVAERVLDVTTRQGQTSTGAIVYRPSNSWDEKFSRSMNHVLGGFNPGIVEQFVTERGGEFVPGRATRAITGTPSKQGVMTTPPEELLTALTGFRRMDLDLPNQIGFLGFEYGKLRSSAKGEYTNAVGANDMSEDKLIDIYRKTNEDLRRAQGQLYQVVQAARALDLKDEDIRFYLKKDAKLGNREIDAVMNGEFDAIRPTDEQAEKVFYETEVKGQPRVMTELPMERLFEVYEEYNNTPVAIQEPVNMRMQNGFAPAPQFESVTPAPEPRPSAPAPAAPQFELIAPPQSSVVPQGATPSQARNEVSPILVPDPATRATFGIG